MELLDSKPACFADSTSALRSVVLLLSRDFELGEAIQREIVRTVPVSLNKVLHPNSVTLASFESVSATVYVPSCSAGLEPDLVEAQAVFDCWSRSRSGSLVLIASAAVYGASFRNPGLISESFPLASQQRLAAKWASLERLAHACELPGHPLIILRCAPLATASPRDPLAQALNSRVVLIPAGHDPSIQVLGTADLARAITTVLELTISSTFNVAPDDAVPFRRAVRESRAKRIALPAVILKGVQRFRGGARASQVDYRRYSWTVSNNAIKAMGFKAQQSSIRSLYRCAPASAKADGQEPAAAYDSFGLDKNYINFFSRTLFKFLADWYWRIEVAGSEHIPDEGRGMLVGTHRGFMPWDGVMALHLIVRATGRYPRFLIHPGLVKFPFLANFMTKLGGIIACQENAARILDQNELLGVFPEGIHGAFVKYSEAYRIQHFHRDAFVKIAIRKRSPIIPFVTVGSAEIFPVLARINSQLWTRYSEWPAFPITPTFPLVPLPLPSKWHTRFLEPMHIEKDYGPDEVRDVKVVRHISHEIRNRMQRAIDEMLSRRSSVFFGSIFSESTP